MARDGIIIIMPNDDLWLAPIILTRSISGHSMLDISIIILMVQLRWRVSKLIFAAQRGGWKEVIKTHVQALIGPAIFC